MVSKSTQRRIRTVLAGVFTALIVGFYLAIIVAPTLVLQAIVVPLFFLPPLVPLFVVLCLGFIVSVWPLVSLGIQSTAVLMEWCEPLFPA